PVVLCSQENILLRWQNGVYVVVPGEDSLDRLAGDARVDELFLTLLRRFTEQGRNVSDKSGTSYAPAQFAEHHEAKEAKVPSKIFVEAMERLFEAKKIRVITEGPPSHPRRRLVVASTDPSPPSSDLPPGCVYRPPITPRPVETGKGRWKPLPVP